MPQPVVPLLARTFRSWVGAKGFWLVAFAALLPLVLTGAWAGAHRADVTAESLSWSPTAITDGDTVNFTGVVRNSGGPDVGSFNVTLAVGTVFGGALRAVASQPLYVDALASGESRTVTLSWTARAGVYYALLDVDSPDANLVDAIPEVDEFNNQKALPLLVRNRAGAATDAPTPPANLTGNATHAAVNVSVGNLTIPSGISPGVPATFTAEVRNEGPNDATVTYNLRAGRAFLNRLSPLKQEVATNVTIPAGETRTVRLEWTPQQGSFWLEGFVNVVNGSDATGADNHAARSFVADPELSPDLTPPAPPEKLTIKEFYLQVLSLLHLKILIPLIGLFYAAGVVSDEKEKGTLVYLLTRPVDRWLIPFAKFGASFLVAASALVVGIVGTYLLLFGTTPGGGDVGFLTTPLLVSLLALFAYGAFFTLLGVLVERPYLVGVAFVVGWETIAGNFVPWVQNLTIGNYIANAITGWKLDAGLQWLPEGPDAVKGLQILLGASVVFLALAAGVMKRKEFEV